MNHLNNSLFLINKVFDTLMPVHFYLIPLYTIVVLFREITVMLHSHTALLAHPFEGCSVATLHKIAAGPQLPFAGF